MRILMVNKFLYQKGGSETYCFMLSEYLKRCGHEVWFFGMAHERNIYGNPLGLNVSNTDFKGITIKKALYPFRIIYSREAARKIREVITAFKPDIVHLNNFSFQLTPAVIYEIKKSNIPMVMTLHDSQLICPNHRMYREKTGKVCEACKGGHYFSCVKNRCIHDSYIKSLLGAFEGWLYRRLKTYRDLINIYIAPSRFIKNKYVEHGFDPNKIMVLHNFAVGGDFKETRTKKEYVLYFGQLTASKGVKVLLEAASMLPSIKFVLAGSGELENEIQEMKNIRFVGFKHGQDLHKLIREALFSVCPSVGYENCPFSVLESQICGTPVIGSNAGGIPELIEDGFDGLLFEPGRADELVQKIAFLYRSPEILREFSSRCIRKTQSLSIENYCDHLLSVYDALADKIKVKEVLWQKESSMAP